MRAGIPKIKSSGTSVVVILFVLYFSLGWRLRSDYGIAFDEIGTRGIGLVSAKYVMAKFYPSLLASHPVFEKVPDLQTFTDRDYGSAFEVLLVGIERIVLGEHQDPYEVYMFRHLCIFISFFAGVIFFYRLVTYRFASWKMGMLGAAFLIASPRIFADSFYNSKDIPLLSAFIASGYCLNLYMERKTVLRALCLGVFTAFTIAIRLVGIMLPVIAGVFVAAEIVWDIKNRNSWKETIRSFAAYCLSTVFLSIVFWPYLWSSPLRHFLDAFRNMSRFVRFYGYVLYNGAHVRSTDVPWHYIPVWISITTPVLYLALFAVGAILIGWILIRRRGFQRTSLEERQDLLTLTLCVVPIGAVIVLHSALYDAWRQLFFVYGFFLLVALSGFHRVWLFIRQSLGSPYRTFASVAFVGLTILSLSTTLAFMIHDHPHQNVYFNLLAGKSAGERFEMDYWGLSYKQALGFIAQHDKRPVIRIHANNISCYANKFTLPVADRDRIQFVDSTPDYYVTEFRHYSDDPVPIYAPEDEVFALNIQGNKIVAVYEGHNHGVAVPFRAKGSS